MGYLPNGSTRASFPNSGWQLSLNVKSRRPDIAQVLFTWKVTERDSRGLNEKAQLIKD